MGKKQKREGGEGFRSRICEALDIVPDSMFGESTVEIRGRQTVRVCECGRILLYTPERVNVQLSRGTLSIYGDRLVCSAYTLGSVRIDGNVRSVSFEEV